MNDRSKPPLNFNINRLPKNLQLTIKTSGVWGPNAIAEAWRLHDNDTNLIRILHESEHHIKQPTWCQLYKKV